MARSWSNVGDIIVANKDLNGVTKGKEYEVVWANISDNLVFIINDYGKKESYSENHFYI